MPIVELIYDRDCPNVLKARENLLRAFSQLGLIPHWKEWDRADPQAPAYTRTYGSPTVLINGKDVAESDAADAACCRIYADGDGKHQGAPTVTLIATALTRTMAPAPKRISRQITSTLHGPVLDNRFRSV